MRPGSCPRQPLSLPEPSRSISRAISPSLPIVMALILLPAIAFANPPDPSWIAGIYDGADGDDVVTFVYETAGVGAPALGSVLPLSCSSHASLVSGPSTLHGFPPQQFTRGPPPPSALVT